MLHQWRKRSRIQMSLLFLFYRSIILMVSQQSSCSKHAKTSKKYKRFLTSCRLMASIPGVLLLNEDKLIAVQKNRRSEEGQTSGKTLKLIDHKCSPNYKYGKVVVNKRQGGRGDSRNVMGGGGGGPHCYYEHFIFN